MYRLSGNGFTGPDHLRSNYFVYGPWTKNEFDTPDLDVAVNI